MAKEGRFTLLQQSRLSLFFGALLWPVILIQGLAVRARVPRLPEPVGDRLGQSGEGPLLRLLIVGDSAAAGVGAAHQDEALLGQLVARLAQRRRVAWRLEATTGDTTARTFERLRALPAAPYDVAVTSLGVNDVTGMVGLRTWLRQQAELRRLLREKFAVRQIIVSGLPPMHAFPALPNPLRWHLGTRAMQFNRALETSLREDDTAVFLEVRFTDDTGLMAEDGFHPGPGVYREWAKRVAGLIR